MPMSRIKVMGSNSRLLRAAAIGACLALGQAGAAFGHAAMVKSEPGAREQLPRPPEAIRLWFNERVEVKYSTIKVETAAGKPVAVGKPVVTADDPYRISVTLPQLAPGSYTVRYRVLSQDGHVVQYGYQFRVEASSDGR